jgi:hypothetical protein
MGSGESAELPTGVKGALAMCGMAIPEVAGLELLKLPQVFVIRFGGIRLLDLNDQQVIRMPRR